MTLSIVFAVALFLLCIAFCLYRSQRSERMLLLDWGVLGIGVIYGLGWAIVIRYTSLGYNQFWSSLLLPFEEYFLLHNILSFSLAVSLVVGWHLSRGLGKLGRMVSSRGLSFNDNKLHRYSWLMLFIAVFLRWLYVRDFGGFIAYLDHATAIRSSVSDVANRFSFLQPFSGVALFSSFLFFASLHTGRTPLKWAGFALSLGFAFYVLFSLLGRLGFLMFLSTFALAYLYIKRTRPSLLILGALFGVTAILVSAFLLSNLLQLKGANSIPEYVSRELSFPFASFFAQLERGEHLYRWYRDFLYSPVYFLPSSLWVNWVDDVSSVNTLVVLGASKGSFGQTAGIPVDLMTLGLMQSSVFGVPVVGALFGALLRFLQGVVDGVRLQGLQAVLLSYFAIRVSFYAIAYAQPLHLISGVFGVIASLLILVLIKTCGQFRWGGAQ